MKKVVVTAVVVLLIEAIAVVVLAKIGFMGVAATGENPAVLDWLLVADRQAAISASVREISVPDLQSAAMVQRGLERFHEMCVGCHGAPGVEQSDVGKGLNPEPPDLAKMGPLSQRQEAHVFWVAKHGIRMTGMPAFGPTHGDDQIWDIVAFVARLQELSPDQYQAMVQALSH